MNAASERNFLTSNRRKARTASRWLVERRVAWCLLAHLGVLVFYSAMSPFKFHQVTLPYNVSSARFQTAITLTLTIVGTIYTAFLLGLTQSLALRRNYGDRQSLTALDDRTRSWLGLWASIKVLLRQRGRIFKSGRIVLTFLYLFLLFGLHNATPALITVTQDWRLSGRPTTVGIVEMTPKYGDTTWATQMPYEELPGLLGRTLPGVMGSMIYDTFSNATLSDWSGTNLSSIMCTTFFEAAQCGASPVQSLTKDSTARQWNVTLNIFDEGQDADVNHTVIIPQPNSTAPLLRFVPLPTDYDRIYLLALWNASSLSTHTSLDTSTDNTSSVYMTFVYCDLMWAIGSANLTNNGTIIPFGQSTFDQSTRNCDRQDSMPRDQTIRVLPLGNWGYNWGSAWVPMLSSPQNSSGVLNNSPSIAETYLLDSLASTFPGITADASDPESQALPNVTDISQALMNMTATLIWLASQKFAGDAWPSRYYVKATYGNDGFVDTVDIYLSNIAWIMGIVLSALSIVTVYALLRGRSPVMHDVDHDGVLELAWLFARDPSDLRPLRDVERPTRAALRNAGQRIPWDAERMLELEGEEPRNTFEMTGKN